MHMEGRWHGPEFDEWMNGVRDSTRTGRDISLSNSREESYP